MSRAVPVYYHVPEISDHRLCTELGEDEDNYASLGLYVEDRDDKYWFEKEDYIKNLEQFFRASGDGITMDIFNDFLRSIHERNIN
jgi:hypothetical protein